jgi:5-methylcytosine-specific restriction protein A
MSNLPLRPCTVPGCPRLSTGPRCDRHTAIAEQVRGKTAERGYDKHHRKLRVFCFQRDNWRCVDCGWEPEIVELYRVHHMGPVPVDAVLDELRRRFNRGDRHLHADHIQTIEDRPDLRLDLDNLATRCDKCHNARTMRELNAGQLVRR